MTAQASERILIEGEWYKFGDLVLPLDHILKSKNIKLRTNTSACWRGYYGHWHIRDQRLYLDRLKYGDGIVYEMFTNRPITMEILFPGQKPPIFANWWTGHITCRFGEQLQYVHVGFASVYEFERKLTFVEGTLVSDETTQRPVQELE